MPTLKQNIEQSITNNKELRKYFILDSLKDYKDKFDGFPTAEQLNWFIFEYKGVRIESEHVQSAINQL